SACADIGCSTSEKPPPVVSPSIMKRTPMLPRKPALPSAGPRTRPEVACIVASFHRTVMSRQLYARRGVCQYSENTNARRNAFISNAAPRRVTAPDPPAHHRERRRAPRDRWPFANVDQRGRGACRSPSLDGLSPLPRRGGALRRLHRPLGDRQPAACVGCLVGDRPPGG